MAIDGYVTQTYPIECKGRNEVGDEVLDTPVSVKVEIHKSSGSNMISSNAECPYNTGGHGQRCKASHPDVDKIGEGVGCPYNFDIPYALETNKDFPRPSENLWVLVRHRRSF
ncbi:MAG TPA: hypothetical protein VJH68_01325 [Candidatus Nanoarchaeia archaeon]|nr:hypothetical protein [Candidatus Nanoarchaeia archaeon]